MCENAAFSSAVRTKGTAVWALSFAGASAACFSSRQAASQRASSSAATSRWSGSQR
jgi:hypothetical protein